MKVLCLCPLVALACSLPVWGRIPDKTVESQVQGAMVEGEADTVLFTANRVDEVGDIFLGEKFFSGFLDSRQRGKLFYWFFPARTDAEKKPLVLWLTGGPGCSSEVALLSENGPFWVNNENATLRLNEHSWTNDANMLYVDQPLNTGFSQAAFHIVVTEEGVAKDMRMFLSNFIEKFPEYKGRPFWMTGESYGGHYLPAIGAFLLKNPVENLNFQGVAIGNGWVDPAIQYNKYADYAKSVGIVKGAGYAAVKAGFASCSLAIQSLLWPLAMSMCNILTEGVIGRRNIYDVREKCEYPPLCYDESGMIEFLNRKDVQDALGVSKPWEPCNYGVHMLLLGDYKTSTLHYVEDILASGKSVLIYHGDQDFICNWMGGNAWVEALKWDQRETYLATEPSKWLVDEEEAGEIRSVGNLAFLRVYDAGHMVPMNQPRRGNVMLQQWLGGEIAPSTLAEKRAQEDAKEAENFFEETVVEL